MAGCLNHGTPIHNRLTGLAVGSADIACLGTGSVLVSKSGQLCIMDVVGRGNGGQLGGHVDGACEGILAVDHTRDHLNVNVDNGHITADCNMLLRYIVITIPSPNADGNADERVAQSLAGDAVLLYGHSQQLGDLVVGEGSLEAVGNDGTLGLPLVGVVQLQGGDQLVHSGQIGHVDIHVVDGLSHGGLTGDVVAGKLHGGIACNGKGAGDLHGITQLILHLEGNSVNTCVQSHVALGGESITGDGRLNNHAVNSDFTGGQIQSGVIGNGSGECHVVAVDHSAVLQSDGGIGGGVGGGGDGGQNSVIHSRGVVQSNVVDVEGNLVSRIGLYVGTKERGRTGVALIGSHGHAEVIVLGNVDGHVHPTGLGNIRIGSRVQVGLIAGNGRGEHEVILLAGVGAVGILYVELGLEGQTLTCGRECILGNVDPHTQGSCLHSVGHVTKNDGLAHVEQDVVGPACKSSIGIVQSPSQCIVTVSDLTAVGGGGDEGIAAQVLIELTGQRSRANQSVIHTVVLRPLLSLLEAHEAGLVAVLKVKEDLGALTELNGVGQYDLAVGDRHVNTGDGRVIGGRELEAVQSTCGGIGQRHGDSVGVYVNVGLTRHSHDGQGDGADLIGRGVRNDRRGSGKLEGSGISHGNGLGTNQLAAGENLHVHRTRGAVGDEQAVLDGTEGCVGQSPRSVSGHIHGVTVGINGNCAEGVGGVGSEDIVVRLHVDHVQLAGGSHVGSHEDTVCGGTLCAVAGNRTHGEVLLTDALGDEGGGSAAVAVGSPLAAESQHNLAFLIGRKALGVVRATTVVHNQNESTVRLNTHHGASGVVTTTAFSLADQLAVLNDHTEGYADSVKQGALLEVLVNVSLIECLNVTGNVTLGILKYVQDRGGIAQSSATGSYVFACVTDPLTVVNQNAGRIRAVIQVGIHTTDDVVAESVLVILSHLGEFLVRPVSLILQILVDLVVTGNDGDVRVRRVNLNDMKHLSAGAGSIIEYDLGLNGRAGNQYVILLGDYVVVAVRAKARAFKNHVVVFPVRDGRKRRQRHSAYEHNNRDQQSDHTFRCFSHDFSPFPKTYFIIKGFWPEPHYNRCGR